MWLQEKNAQGQYCIWRMLRGLMLLLLIGGAVVFSPSAFAHSQVPARLEEDECIEVYGFHMPQPPMQGIAGTFILKNECIVEVSGSVLLHADITNCRYSGPFGNTATQQLKYTLGPDAEHLYTLGIEASCIKCNCLSTDPERVEGFDLHVSVYNEEGGTRCCNIACMMGLILEVVYRLVPVVLV